jgi:hypothetical protein
MDGSDRTVIVIIFDQLINVRENQSGNPETLTTLGTQNVGK